MQDLLDRPKGGAKGKNYRDWIAKAEKTRQASGSRYWCLVVRRDKALPLLVFPQDLSLVLAQEGVYLMGHKFVPFAYLWVNGECLTAVSALDFLTLAKPEIIRKVLRGVKSA